MKPTTLAAIAVVLTIPVTAVGIATAEEPPISVQQHVGAAQLPDDVKVNADGVKFKTKDPTDVSVLTLTVAPEGSTGWHTHPGLAVIAVTEGTGTLYYADCSSETFEAGEAFVESGKDAPTLFVNETDSPVVLTVTFVTPDGADPIRPGADPGC